MNLMEEKRYVNMMIHQMRVRIGANYNYRTMDFSHTLFKDLINGDYKVISLDTMNKILNEMEDYYYGRGKYNNS